jgi:hypothetical protein
LTINPESIAAVNVLAAMESVNTHEAPIPAEGTLSLDIERYESVISGPYLEATASSQIGRNPGEIDFSLGGVMDVPKAAKNKARVSHTNIESVNQILDQHRSDGYSVIRG